MRNPFDELPRGLAERRAIMDSVLSHEVGLKQDEYEEIDNILAYGYLPGIDRILKKYGLRYGMDDKVDAFIEGAFSLNIDFNAYTGEVPRDLPPIEFFNEFIEITDFVPDWRKYNFHVQRRYGAEIEAKNLKGIKSFSEYCGVQPDWEYLRDYVNSAYTALFYQDYDDRRYYENYIQQLEQFSGIGIDWQGELRDGVMEEYGRAIESLNFSDCIEYIREITGVMPDWDGVLKEKLFRVYERKFFYELYDNLQELIRLTGIEPDWQGELRESVLQRYKDCIHGTAVRVNIENLKSLTGIEPDWQGELKEDVLKVFALKIKEAKLKDLLELQEVTGISPNWKEEYANEIAEAYIKILDNYINLSEALYLISGLENLTGAVADWHGSLKTGVDKLYKRYLIYNSWKKIEEIKALTGIEPDWQGVLSETVNGFVTESIKEGRISSVKGFAKKFNIEINWAQYAELIQGRYKKCLKSGDPDGIRSVFENTGIEPDWSGELKEYIDTAYAGLLRNKELRSLDYLIAMSGIAPDWQGKLDADLLIFFDNALWHRSYKDLKQLNDLSGGRIDWSRYNSLIKNHYAVLLSLEAWDEIETLSNILGIKPDWRDELKRFLDGLYKLLIKDGNIAGLLKAMEKTGVQPDWQGEYKEQFNALCVEMINESRDSHLQEFIAKTDIEPDWQGSLKPVIDKKCRDLLKRGKVQAIESLLSLSKAEFDWQKEMYDEVQSGYARLLERDSFEAAENLRVLTMVEPDIKTALKTTIDYIFAELIQQDRVNKIRNLLRFLGDDFVMSEEMHKILQERYREYILNKKIMDRTAGDLIKFTGVKPDWPRFESELEEVYIRYLRHARYEDIKELEQFSGVKPDWQGKLAVLVRDVYMLNLSVSTQFSIPAIMKKTGVSMDWEEPRAKQRVLEAYDRYLREHCNPADLLYLQNLTGITPDWRGELRGLVQELYIVYLRQEEFAYIKDLNKITGVEINWNTDLREAVINKFLDFLRFSNFKKFEDLRELSGVQPDWKGELKSRFIRLLLSDFLFNASVDKYLNYCGYTWDELAVDETFWVFALSNAATTDNIKLEILLKPDTCGDKGGPIFESVLSKEYYKYCNAAVEQGGNAYDFVYNCINRYKVKPSVEVMTAIFSTSLIADDSFDRFLTLAFLCGYRNLGKLKPEDVQGKDFSLRQLAIMDRLNLYPDEPEERMAIHRELSEKGNKVELVSKMLKARNVSSPAKRAEYCPWQNELMPLIHSFWHRFTFPDSVECGRNVEALIFYIQKFGMKNLPLLAESVMDLYVYRQLLSDENEEEAVKNLWIKYTLSESGIRTKHFFDTHGIEIKEIRKPQDIDKLIDRLHQIIEKIKEDVLNDRMPDVLEQTSLDMELFNSVMVRAGRWGNDDHGYGREELIGTWREAKEGGRGDLPDYFMPMTFQMERQKIESIDDVLKALQEQEEGKDDLVDKRNELERQRTEVLTREEYVAYLAPFYAAINESIRLGREAGDPNIVFVSAVNALKVKIEQQRIKIGQLPDDENNANRRKGMLSNLRKQEELLAKMEKLASWEGIKELLDEAIAAKQEKALQTMKAKQKAEAKLEQLIREMDDLSKRIRMEGETEKLLKLAGEMRKEIQQARTIIDASTVLSDVDAARLEYIRSKMDDEELFDADAGIDVEYLKLQIMFTAVAESFDQKTINSHLGYAANVLVMALNNLEAHGHLQDIQEAYEIQDKKVQFQAWRAFFQEQLMEHFLDPDNLEGLRTVYYTEAGINLMETIFRVNNLKQKSLDVLGGEADRKIKHPFLRAVADINGMEKDLRILDKEGVRGMKEAIEVTYHPCHGLGRIFSGDVGDACYTSHRIHLARGEYPNLHSIIMSGKDPKTGDVKLLGSILLIEGKDVNGKRYLFARAVNPIDSVLKREIDAEEFLKGLLEYLRTTAEKAGFDEALLCIDTRATASGSNRAEMFDAMVRAAADNNWPIADRLESKPETNFKYSVWDTQLHRVYRVWERTT
ncbi:MAG: hypothetical protein ACOYUZ_02965 [Patescibacteria group bacterium]